jgi:hypothetical protein
MAPTGKVAHYDGKTLRVNGEVVPKYEYMGNNQLRESITSVTFPVGLQRIGDFAFCRCPLTQVTFPVGLESIGDSAFNGCSITSVTFPAGLQRIGGWAFYRCPLTSVIFPEGLQQIGVVAFGDCPLTQITFPQSLQRIRDFAFRDCPLTDVFLPDSNLVIEPQAFYGCTQLQALAESSGYTDIVSYLRFQPTVRRRIAVLLCLQRLRDEYYGDDYITVESVGTTPAEGTLEGKLAFQMITSDDLWRYILEFV